MHYLTQIWPWTQVPQCCYTHPWSCCRWEGITSSWRIFNLATSCPASVPPSYPSTVVPMTQVPFFYSSLRFDMLVWFPLWNYLVNIPLLFQILFVNLRELDSQAVLISQGVFKKNQCSFPIETNRGDVSQPTPCLLLNWKASKVDN